MKQTSSLLQKHIIGQQRGVMPTYWSAINFLSNDRTPELLGVLGGQVS